MTFMQEFLVLERDDGRLGVYGVGQLPAGTAVGREARRLRVVGAAPVKPPALHLTGPDLDRWGRQLQEQGYTVTMGPFWTNPDLLEMSDEAIRRRRFVPLKDAFDELLRHAERRGEAENPPDGACRVTSSVNSSGGWTGSPRARKYTCFVSGHRTTYSSTT